MLTCWHMPVSAVRGRMNTAFACLALIFFCCFGGERDGAIMFLPVPLILCKVVQRFKGGLPAPDLFIPTTELKRRGARLRTGHSIFRRTKLWAWFLLPLRGVCISWFSSQAFFLNTKCRKEQAKWRETLGKGYFCGVVCKALVLCATWS